MGVAAENSSVMGLQESSEGAKRDKNLEFAAEVAKKSVSDKKKSGEVTSYVKNLCFCAPTTHPGSFKCRLHRANTARIKTPRLSRFARDLSQHKYESLLNPQYHSE